MHRAEWACDLEEALLASKLCAYAQGMALLAAASSEFQWALPLAQLAQIWRGGCIIRARVLSLVHAAYSSNPNLPNLLLDAAVSVEVCASSARFITGSSA